VDGQQVWQFAGIQMSADSIRKVGASVNTEQEAIKGNLAALASVWGGGSSELYQSLQNRWNVKSTQVNDAVMSLAAAIDNANMHMQSTEAKVGSRFV
jgi:6 kDa early secretory antigenic target